MHDKDITVITLSKTPHAGALKGLAYLNSVQTVKDCTDYNRAFLNAVLEVSTPYFFFLDDDDSLPDDYLSVLGDCLAAKTAVAYTDELRRFNGSETIYRPGTYSTTKHFTDPALLHHLVLCDTQAAVRVVERLPRGQFWPEMPLYFELAKQSAHYVPRVGYHWNRSGSGLNSQADFSIGAMRSLLWCQAQ